MSMTMTEKALARAAGMDKVVPGDIVVCRPDVVVQLDIPLTIEGQWYRPKKLYDRDRIALIFDHAIPAPTIKDAEGMIEGRAFVEQFGIKHFTDVGSHGICHQIIAERGLARPGQMLICLDSHTCAAGAFNCAARGTGPIDTLRAMVKGDIWFEVYPTVRYELVGNLPPFVTGKDVFFHIAEEYGGHSGLNVEFGGSGMRTLPLVERRTISTMCAEISAEFAIFEHDEVLEQWMRSHTDQDYVPVHADPDARYADVRTVRLDELEPYIIKPDAVPNNGLRVSQLEERINIDQAFVGSCANGKLEDLRLAADIVRGKRVAPGTRFLVTPASQQVYRDAVREGIVETLMSAGAVVTNSTCGACFGYHMGVVGAGEVCITASTRNFRGRMGSPDARVYMGSPATVAASAIAGYIIDPRDLS
jgi:3-isopropylmalate/(R)-2-methylmalate dehydratase large subunit